MCVPTGVVNWIQISNAAKVTRPVVKEIQLYSDSACSVRVEVPKDYDSAANGNAFLPSGWTSCSNDAAQWGNFGAGCEKAFDNQKGLSTEDLLWRPKCTLDVCDTGDAWIRLRLLRGEQIRCVRVIDDVGGVDSFSKGGVKIEMGSGKWDTVPSKWGVASVSTARSSSGGYVMTTKTQLKCSTSGFCVSREGGSNWCYGKNDQCLSFTPSINGVKDFDCTQDSDCSKYNVANPVRWTDTSNNGRENDCLTVTNAWQKELCAGLVETTCNNGRGCEKFKTTLKLKDLPATLVSGTFSGPHFSAVTGDLSDLKGMTNLETLSLGTSSLITGDLNSLSGLAKLKHIDLSASQLWGDVTHLSSATCEYANFASSRGIFGDLNKLPKALKYGNFRASRYLKGDVKDLSKATAATAGCNLIELDISGAFKGQIKGELQKTGAAIDSLIERCPNIKYIDLGSNYGTSGTTDVKIGNYVYANHLTRCIKANGLATKGCKP